MSKRSVFSDFYRQLKNLRHNQEESYNTIWYFAAHKTKLESLHTGKKGILFIMGDELMPNRLKAGDIKKYIDKNYTGMDILTSDLLKQVSEKYEVFHLIVQDTPTYRELGKDRMDACWKQYLGERAISVASHTDIPQMIIHTIQSLCESLHMEKLAIHEKPEIAEKEANFAVVGDIGKFGGPFSGSHSRLASSLSTLSKDSDKIPHLFRCPITLELMKDPVVAEDGFTYDRASITQWLQKNNTSPQTKKIIGKLLFDNNDLKSAIKEWQEKQEKEKQVSSSGMHP